MDFQLADIVKATAGRDKHQYFIITKLINEQFVMIVDGKRRTIEKPKLKKIKHIVKSGISTKIKEKLCQSEKISNADIRKEIKSFL